MATESIVDQMLDILQGDLLAGTDYVSISEENREFLFSDDRPPVARREVPASRPAPRTEPPPPPSSKPVWRPPSEGGAPAPVEPPERKIEQRPAWRPPDEREQRRDEVPDAATVQAHIGAAAGELGQMSLTELESVVSGCRNCLLCQRRKQTVFGEGDPNADLMFIGEGPGADEDRLGRPFVGKAGQLLDKIIGAMGFERSEVYIANIVKCRPPGNRTPFAEEAAHCLPYLKRQIELIQPKVIVTLGATPLDHLIGKKGITRNRGHWFQYEGIRVMPTFHPSFLLRFEREPTRMREEKGKVWSDMQQVMQVFGKTPPQRPNRG